MSLFTRAAIGGLMGAYIGSDYGNRFGGALGGAAMGLAGPGIGRMIAPRLGGSISGALGKGANAAFNTLNRFSRTKGLAGRFIRGFDRNVGSRAASVNKYGGLGLAGLGMYAGSKMGSSLIGSNNGY